MKNNLLFVAFAVVAFIPFLIINAHKGIERQQLIKERDKLREVLIRHKLGNYKEINGEIKFEYKQ